MKRSDRSISVLRTLRNWVQCSFILLILALIAPSAANAATPAVLLSPIAGSVLSSSSVTFTWSAGSQVSNYKLCVGTAKNNWNIYSSTFYGRSATVSSLPTNGSTVWVMLSSYSRGNWLNKYYTYTAQSRPSVAVSLSPASTSLTAGGTTSFTASVTGSTNTSVTWTATGGSISGTGTTVTYTAPATVGTYTITATSAADTTKKATATVTVTSVAVSLSPTSTSLTAGGTTSFTASVTGSTNTSVTWTATGGSISGTGATVTYTAPATAGTYTITATSAADTTKKATATVTVTSVAISLSPTSTSLTAGGTSSFTASVTGSTNTSVTWTATGGSISGTGTTVTYTAPATVGTYTITATSAADTTKKATATVTVTSVAVSLSPTSTSLTAGGTTSFTASVTGSTNTSVTWTATGGSISGTGTTVTYTAPATAGTYTITATSAADTTKTATATVTVTSVAVSLSPASTSLTAGGTTSFTASVTGSTNTSVTWTATGGSISGTGTTVTYTAPAAAGTYTITATSAADATKTATATVTVTSVAISLSPTSTSLTAGGTAGFTASVTGSTNTSVTWTATGGSISGTGTTVTYTAPAAAGTYTITATSAADATKTATATVTVTAVQSSVTIVAYQTSYHVVPGSTQNIWVNVCNGTNTTFCTRPSSLNVNWSVSGGCTLSSTSTVQYVSFTAPATAGSCTVVATPAAGGSSATINIQVESTKLRHYIAPVYTVLYKGQYTILQSLLYGNANTAVSSWAVSPNNGGLVLNGSGRAVGVQGVTAGTYTVTATSALGTTTSATVVVTANAMPSQPLPSKVFPVDCTAVGSGTTYEVTSNATFDAVPWNTLKAGDTVRLHYSSTPYIRQVQIKTSGTATQPIRVCGVSDPATGNLPVIDGTNAVPENFTSNIPNWGGIVLFSNYYGYDTTHSVNYVLIEGLKMQNFTTTTAHTPTYDDYFGVPIVIRGGHDILIRGMELTNSSEGISMSPEYPETYMNRRVVVEGNWLHNNGVNGNYSRHSAYLQGDACIVQGNYFGINVAGSQGSTLKDRCTNTYVRYNYLEGTQRTIDFCELQDWAPLGVPASFSNIDPGDSSTTMEYVTSVNETYQHAYAYGNVLNDDESINGTAPMFPIHYFPDVQPAYDYDASIDTMMGGTLYFYNNTVMSKQNGGAVMQFDVSRGQSAQPVVWPSVVVVNNAFAIEPTGSVNPNWVIAVATTDRVTVGNNWASSSWSSDQNSGIYWYVASYPSDFHPYQTAGDYIHVTGASNLKSSSSLPFDSTTWKPVTNSALTGTASPLPTEVQDLTPQFNYFPSTQQWAPRTTSTDIGALSSN